MNKFDDKKLEQLLKDSRPIELNKKERDFIVKSKDEIYKNILKKTSKFFIILYLLYLLKKLTIKFASATIPTKIVSTVVATAVISTPVTIPLVKKYIKPDTGKKTEDTVEDKKVETNKPAKGITIIKSIFAFKEMKVKASTLDVNVVNNIKKIFYSSMLAKKKNNLTLQIGANKIPELGIYYAKVKILNKNNIIVYHSRKEANNLNDIFTYLKQQAGEIAKKYVK